MENQKHNKVSEWLEGLQRESWQLELIVSGFAIFLLLKLANILPDIFPNFNIHTDFPPLIRTIFISFFTAAIFATNALVINLIFHIFLRGFWIAALGLRSVQQETNFDKLNYSLHFTDKLKRLVPSLDRLIIRLDNLCSVVFAFAFLLVFMFLSFALWVFVLNTLGFLIQMLMEQLSAGFLKTALSWFFNLIAIVVSVTSIIYFLDTLSLGFFKKYQRIAKIYYPIYRLWGWITLAGIYRGIYYSLVSRFPKNMVRLFLFVFLFLIVLFPFSRITFYKYFPDYNSGAKSIAHNCYDNLRGDDVKIWTTSIASDVVDKEYLPLFIRYDVKDNEVLDSICTNYTPTKGSIFVSGIQKGGFRDPVYKEEDPDKLLDCLVQLYNVYINDSLYTDMDFYFYTHPNDNEKGLRTMIYTGNLAAGKNTIRVKRQSLNKEKKLYEKGMSTIPFWLESRE